MNASGTLDPLAARAAGLADRRRARAARDQDRHAAGARGQRPRRACAEVTGGMLNSIGLPNPGLDAFAETVLPEVRALGRPLVVSVGGFEHAGLRAGLQAPRWRARHRRARAERLLPERQERLHLDRQRRGRDRGRRPSLPLRHQPAAVGQALAERGRPRRDRARGRTRRSRRARAHEHAARARARPRDATAAARRNHRRARPARRSSRSRWRPSTPAARPCALPIVGVGGIASGGDALEFLAAGAAAVQVGSAAFREPLLARRVREELATLLQERGLGAVSALKPTTLD